MLIKSAGLNATATACGLAALLEGRERVDGSFREALVQRFNQPARFPDWHREAQRLARIADTPQPRHVNDLPLGALLALAYPDRIGQCLSPGRFKLANGKTATLPLRHMLACEPYIVAVNLDSIASEAAIYQAEPLSGDCLVSLYPATQQWANRITWSDAQGKLVGERVQCLGELVLASQPLNELPADEVTKALLTALKQRPEIVLSPHVQQLQGRMALLRDVLGESWPDWSAQQLIDTLDTWLGPYMTGVTRMSQLEKMPFHTFLLNVLSWEEQTLFERLTPVSLTVPSGRQATLDYAPCVEGRPPVLAIKLQEAFGWQATPTIVEERVAVVMHLLSPARRPLQVTQDLRSFWTSGYPEVRKEMRGRYPKHPWPEDPFTSPATARTKQRGQTKAP